MASMLGANAIVANDIQLEAMDNIREHYLINDCKASINILHGGLEVVEPNTFDIVLANINTVVLSHSANNLKQLVKSGEVLLLSGILEEKESTITTLYQEAGFKLQEVKHRGDWCCIRFTH
jgi:ribosomal protein L11 methyltransferase